MNDNFAISEAAFEFTVEKMQQTIKRLVIAILALVLLFVGIVGGLLYAFIHYENQFETDYFNISTDKGGNAVYSYSGDGDINYGNGQG